MTETNTAKAGQSPSSNVLKVRARFADRVGIVADISTRIAECSLNIVLMEVVRREDEAIVYIELEHRLEPIKIEKILDIFFSIESFKEVKVISTLPLEERTNRISVVLDNISDGVISIDSSGALTTINKIAARVLMVDPDEVIGKSIFTLNLPDYPILDCLQGHKIDNVKRNLITSRRRYQYLSTCKPIRDSRGQVIGAVEISRDMQKIKQMAQTFSDSDQVGFTDIIGENSAMQEAIALAERMAATDLSIAIHGASGTGKELFARAIHSSSGRLGPFVPINCAALPEHLLESELFGYVAGTFTGGAKNGKPGLFEVADQGTVFLDEIADLPLASQAKLLRLIQEKAVRRIGGAKEIPIDVRILTASNKRLEQLVERQLFRKDLYYRISVLPIHIPPLRQRPDDIERLAEHFLFSLASKLGKEAMHLSPAASQKLMSHQWPGNVRELKNVVERATILCGGTMIEADHILFSHELGQQPIQAAATASENQSSLKELVGEFEKSLIVRTMAREKSVRQTARALNLSHPGLLKKMKKHGIHGPQSYHR